MGKKRYFDARLGLVEVAVSVGVKYYELGNQLDIDGFLRVLVLADVVEAAER